MFCHVPLRKVGMSKNRRKSVKNETIVKNLWNRDRPQNKRF